MSRWRYKLTEDYTYESPHLAGISFCSDWLLIDGGRLLIRAGYAWDGCSPAWRLPGGVWVGTPDGPLGADGRPQSYYASLVHDALCQYKADVPITKAATLALFADLLRQGGFPPWRVLLYVAAVKLFGPARFAGDGVRGNTGVLGET